MTVKGSVMAHREVYYVDYSADFGLSGLAGTVCHRTRFRIDEPTMSALAARAFLDEDDQLGRDVRLLLESPLPDETLRAVWLAATRRGFDPAEHGLAPRAWLHRVSEMCPPRPPVGSEGGPTVTEEELRDAVSAELRLLAPALTTAVPVPDLVPGLERVVREADADLGLRLLLRALKAYSVRVPDDQYHRFLHLGDRLDYPQTAVFEDLSVCWPPLGAVRRDFEFGFGLPELSRQFDGEWDAWRYEGTGTPREHVVRFVHADAGLVPGVQAAVLLEDATCLLDSPLTDEQITAVWRTASRRRYTSEDFDADGRTWLRQIAEVCRERLNEADPAYTPGPRPPRTDLADAVLTEVQAAAPALGATGAALIGEVVTGADPDLGFRLLLRLLDAYEAPITEARYTRFERLADRLGCGEDYVRRELERRITR
ncbi:hypothetical protein OOK58_20695 [Streptomyces sp. NBC_01728]|uniref:hypothetical protein n=1 Tax=unclassified Streptomyces TaxID=2593676 RepID=UPI00225A0FDE|nr:MULTISPECIES: hypothetical protein [unclassified Streptomyces]MCX4454466.1 hypothetical protein [Streptomyces sp. NBC_01719]MCX4493826.1 hypothetical protein [Streptomyces sp. NBC_01728]